MNSNVNTTILFRRAHADTKTTIRWAGDAHRTGLNVGGGVGVGGVGVGGGGGGGGGCTGRVSNPLHSGPTTWAAHALEILLANFLSGPARQEIGGVPTPLCIISIGSR